MVTRSTRCYRLHKFSTGYYPQQVFPVLFYFSILFKFVFFFHMIPIHYAVTLDMILMSANKCFISVPCRDFVTEY